MDWHSRGQKLLRVLTILRVMHTADDSGVHHDFCLGSFRVLDCQKVSDPHGLNVYQWYAGFLNAGRSTVHKAHNSSHVPFS